MIIQDSIHTILKRSNSFWHALYYDELIELEECHISFLRQSDRLYYNAAHAISSVHSELWLAIENEFLRRSLIPAIYWDLEAPSELMDSLKARNYNLIPEETEVWYCYSLAQCQKQTQSHQNVIAFSATEGEYLEQFLHINAVVNDLSPLLVKRLKNRLLSIHSSCEIILFLVYENEQPVGTTALGIVDGFGFTAEVATLPQYRRRGHFLTLTDSAVEIARGLNCRMMYVNCDAEAFSNQGYLRYGYQKIFTRYYYQKNRGQ